MGNVPFYVLPVWESKCPVEYRCSKRALNEERDGDKLTKTGKLFQRDASLLPKGRLR